MIPIVHNLVATRGDSFDEAFRLWDSDPTVVFTLTGYTGKAQVRSEASDPVVKAELTVTLMDQTQVPGGFVLALTPTQAAALVAGTYVYDIEFANAGRTDVDTYVSGSFIVNADVSRP